MDANLEQLFTIQETLDRLSSTGLDKNSAETATDKDPWSSKSSLDSTSTFCSHPTLFPSLSSHGTRTNKVLPPQIQSNTGLMSQGVAFMFHHKSAYKESLDGLMCVKALKVITSSAIPCESEIGIILHIHK